MRLPPLMLAVKTRSLGALWSICQQDRLVGKTRSGWGVEEAKALADKDLACLNPLNYLNQGDKNRSAPRTWFSFWKNAGSTNSGDIVPHINTIE